ncbi:EamA family transporter [Kaistia algarum]|uniref:DMT family transporter n=1 Tax=Kaistia algarum TaxID=2083279 RepID=UPI000CE725A6|nr:DMT family transporter [Kaistia algarum]MCX5514444.1 DMT family transporter [Kaistia algarum]PPE79178.1 EamA family transporter [Kaistia algarum]
MTATTTRITPTDRAARRSRLFGYGFAAAGALLFSSKGIAIKLAYAEGVDAETLLALRMILAMPVYVIIGAIALADRRRLRRPPIAGGLILRIVLVGLLGYWVSSYLDFLGLETISAQFERLILFTYPLWVVLFGAAFFGQKVRPRALIAFGVAYGGLALMFNEFAAASPVGIVFGVSVVLCAAVTFAMYQLLAKGLIERIGSGLFTCIAMISAGVAVVIQFALTHPLSAMMVSPRIFAIGCFLAIGATVLPSFFMNAALQRIPASSNATIGMLSPVGTIFLAMIVLGEWLSPIEWLGTVLVIAGIAWFTISDRRQAAKSP